MSANEPNGNVRLARLEEWRSEMTKQYDLHLDDCDDFRREIREGLVKNADDHEEMRTERSADKLHFTRQIAKVATATQAVATNLHGMTVATRVLWAVAVVATPLITAGILHLLSHRVP